MRRLIEIHNKSTYQRIYNRFSAEFIDSYCAFKSGGFNTRDSLAGARNKMETLLEIQLKENKLYSKTVVKAFNNVSNDSKLIEKAIKYYKVMER